MDPIQSIVVPTDFSPLSQSAVARAVALARLDSASIHLVHAVSFPLVATPYETSVPVAVWEGVREGARQQLEEIKSEIEKSTHQTVTTEVADSRHPSQAIATAVETHRADLVVMGTHGHSGIQHAFLGSVAERTIRSLRCPVLVVKEEVEKAGSPISRILLAVDFSADSDRATLVAASLAKSLDASIDVVHAIDLPHDYVPYASDFGIDFEQKIQASVSERLEQVRAQIKSVAEKIPVSLHAQRGHPSVAIAEFAEESDCQLVVVGTRGLTGLPHIFLGSVAERTLRTAPCSVLVVTAPGDA